jgi:flagellar hook-length control protein FliK
MTSMITVTPTLPASPASTASGDNAQTGGDSEHFAGALSDALGHAGGNGGKQDGGAKATSSASSAAKSGKSSSAKSDDKANAEDAASDNAAELAASVAIAVAATAAENVAVQSAGKASASGAVDSVSSVAASTSAGAQGGLTAGSAASAATASSFAATLGTVANAATGTSTPTTSAPASVASDVSADAADSTKASTPALAVLVADASGAKIETSAPQTASAPAAESTATSGSATANPGAAPASTTTLPNAAPTQQSGARDASATEAVPVPVATASSDAAPRTDRHGSRESLSDSQDVVSQNTTPTAAQPVPVQAPQVQSVTPPSTVSSPPPVQHTLAQPELANTLSNLRLRGDGTHELTVQLHPAELGVVNVIAVLHGNTLNVTVAAADPAARAAITAALPQLQSQLDQSGFSGLDLSFGQPNPQTFAGQQQSQGTAPSSSTRASVDTAETTTTERPSRRVLSAGLDALDRWL